MLGRMSESLADLIRRRFGLPTESGRARPATGTLAQLNAAVRAEMDRLHVEGIAKLAPFEPKPIESPITTMRKVPGGFSIAKGKSRTP